MKYDVIVIGSGPAGLSAAINVRARGGAVICIGTDKESNSLWKAPRVDNYPGMPCISGKDMLNVFIKQAEEAGVVMLEERVLAAYDTGSGWMVSAGSEVIEGYAVVFAGGVVRGKTYPGEEEFIGKGVSYCTTCDGMLYRGKKTAVIGFTPGGVKEAEYLISIGSEATWLESPRQVSISGDGKVQKLHANGQEYNVDGVFILRPSLAPTRLFPQIKTDGNYICIDRDMATNLSGVYAAGDCTGTPLQVAKAVGEGLVAGLNAAAYAIQKKDSMKK